MSCAGTTEGYSSVRSELSSASPVAAAQGDARVRPMHCQLQKRLLPAPSRLAHAPAGKQGVCHFIAGLSCS